MTRRASTASHRAKALGRPPAAEGGVPPIRFVPPYPPSWIDRLTAVIDRLPGPSWLAYVAAAFVMNLLLSAAHWLTGASPLGRFDRVHFLLAAAIPFALGIVDYLDREALKALEEFRPALRASDAEVLLFRYRLVTIPAWTAVWSGLAFIVVAVAVGSGVPLLTRETPLGSGSANPLAGALLLLGVAPTPLATTLGVLIVIAMFFTEGAAVYHILNQMVTISRIYTHHTNVDLFRLAPLYAFSRHTARTSIVLLGAGLFGFLLVPGLYTAGVIVMSIFFLALVMATFILPLAGAHRLLGQEKERLLTENGAMLKATVAELHRRVASGRLRDMDNMNKAMASLEIEHAALARIPTWPWEPGTVRSVVAAVLLPVFLYAVQQILSRTLGG